MAKCYCGRELEEERQCSNCGLPESACEQHEGRHWVLRDPEDPNSGEPCGEIVTVLVCPVHGENCVWRPCVFAGKIYGSPYAPFRVCKIAGDDFDENTGWYPEPETCAACPIPALVAAVEGLLRTVDHQKRAERETNSDRFYAYEDLVRIETEKAQAALAMLPKPEETT